MTERQIPFQEFKAISRAILAYEDIPLLAGHISQRICAAFGIRGCSVMLFDEREGQLFRVASWGISQEYLNKGPLFIDAKSSAFATGRPVFIQDFQNDPRIQYPEAAAREGIVSMLSIPLRHHGEPLGILRMYHNRPWQLNDGDLDSFTLLADLMGLVIEHGGLKNVVDKIRAAMSTLPPRLLKDI